MAPRSIRLHSRAHILPYEAFSSSCARKPQVLRILLPPFPVLDSACHRVCALFWAARTFPGPLSISSKYSPISRVIISFPLPRLIFGRRGQKLKFPPFWETQALSSPMISSARECVSWAGGLLSSAICALPLYSASISSGVVIFSSPFIHLFGHANHSLSHFIIALFSV